MQKIISIVLAIAFVVAIPFHAAEAGQGTHHKRSHKEKYDCSLVGKPSKINDVRESKKGVIGNGEIKLRWNDSFRAHLVEIEYGVVGGKKSVKKTGDDGTQTFRSLINGKPVEFRVRGVSNCGKSSWSKRFVRLP